MMPSINNMKLNDIVNDIVLSGLSNPSRGYIELMRSPKRIRDEILRPTDKRIFSVWLNPLNLSTLMRSNPGMKVRKEKPNI
jgi:hypothetical protein